MLTSKCARIVSLNIDNRRIKISVLIIFKRQQTIMKPTGSDSILVHVQPTHLPIEFPLMLKIGPK